MIKEENLPDGWKIKELKDVCLNKAEYGSGAKAIDYDENKPRYIRITDINENGKLRVVNKVSPSEIEEKYFLHQNDFLFARSGATVGKNYLYNKEDGSCQFAGYLIRFKLNTGLVDPNYLYYFTKSPYYWNWVDSKQKTMTLPNINAKQYSGLKIPIPPLKTQQKIVEILEKAEKLKEWRAESDVLADEYLKSVFLEMFGDPMKNPYSYDLKTLKEICQKITDGTHDTPKRLKEGILFITGKNIKPYTIDLSDVDYVSENDHEIIFNRCNPSFEDVLYTNIGVNVGTAAINSFKFPFSMKNVALIKPKRNCLNPYYLEHLLNYPNMRLKILDSNSIGGAQKFLSLKMINNFRIPLPPIQLQNQFAETVKKVEQLKQHQKQSKQEIDNLFNTLMQKTFKGELTC